MAKFSLKKYPKKPKSTASNEVKKRFLDRCKEIDKENVAIKKAKEESKKLTAQIAKIGRS
jgi:hypothetical protein